MPRLTEDIQVVAVEYGDKLLDIGAASAKSLPPGRRYRYAREHTLILKDGQRVEGTIRAMTKPKLAERIASEQDDVAKGRMSCSQSDWGDGPYWSTSVKYYLGA